MSFGKTEQAVLRHVFGFNDASSDRQVGISCNPQRMAVRGGSREYKVGLQLEGIGVARLVRDLNCWGLWHIEATMAVGRESGK